MVLTVHQTDGQQYCIHRSRMQIGRHSTLVSQCIETKSQFPLSSTRLATVFWNTAHHYRCITAELCNLEDHNAVKNKRHRLQGNHSPRGIICTSRITIMSSVLSIVHRQIIATRLRDLCSSSPLLLVYQTLGENVRGAQLESSLQVGEGMMDTHRQTCSHLSPFCPSPIALYTCDAPS